MNTSARWVEDFDEVISATVSMEKRLQDKLPIYDRFQLCNDETEREQ